ncbi:iron complex outermembrane receptor protein [Parabacteroides sp. PF5-5]|uniref:outer membrane beta-barrel family protein n=1 Tax=unclassified Parabacteroides TaxID=2649774 RepID=UPI002474D49D|nr:MULTISPECIES: outer membrane beta-barrel family protein [unclassified Parabacteroides]MDH6306630.1 iron complex outermembrane receptor protein [Parabacteroides sp. PH5-39]MDH6317597.1 iron complex outermembrane receptor protein [Parabacteroides sp. PF5-13]MDH6321341.1 iron complex outermembrane receptor protein [Parabacteroides sp. PH5-13]MDH6325094.1 iron complex outermembrane receptor protein [Parabacteroides sp. PH5-8]MDH6328803.1 iron complex outermembrane receptor protein [Parabacteroi
MKLIFTIILLSIMTIQGALYAQEKADTTLQLKNITVHGKRFGGLSGGDIRKLDVESSQSVFGATTAEAIRQLPSLITDIEGGVTYRGTGKSGILLNGVPYGLLEEYSGDVLIQLPALFFNHISLSSYPAIDLIPDGEAGMLNLASSTYSPSDPLMQLSLGAGLQERYNAGAILNLHPGKFHITGKYNYRREYRERSFQKTTTNVSGTTEMNNNASARPDIHLADLNIGYDISPKDVISVYGLYHLMEYDRYGGINNTRKNPAGEVMNKMLRHRFNRQKQDAYAVEARWSHRFNHPSEKLDIVFNYNNNLYDENNDYKNEKPETGVILAEDQLFVDHEKKNYYASATYQKTWNETFSFKGGYAGRFRDESYTSKAYNKVEDKWVENTGKSNIYTFKRYTNMLFASLEKKLDRLTVEAGVQAEHQKQEMENTDHSRFRLYPRVKIAYQTGNTDEISLKYIQRSVRPYGMDLNPFVDMSDATYIKQGNPHLKEELIHSIEIGYQLNSRNVHISPTLYYRNRQNRIMDMATELDGQAIWKKENIGNTQTFGAELAGYWSPVNPLSLMLSYNIYRDEIDGRIAGYTEKKSLTCMDIKGHINWAITRRTDLQIDGFYISDQLTPQGKIKNRYSINAGISHDLLPNRLQANLSIQNIFNSLEETTIINSAQTQMTQIRNRDSRVTWLTLIYRLKK